MQKKIIALLLLLLVIITGALVLINANDTIIINTASNLDCISLSELHQGIATVPTKIEVLIEFPRQVKASDVIISTIRLDNTLKPTSSWNFTIELLHQSYLVLYFNGTQVLQIILSKLSHEWIPDYMVELNIRGEFVDNRAFEGILCVCISP